MVVRWNALLLTGVLAGGSMLIENSHRLDTGAPDEEIVGARTCTTVVSARVWKPGKNEPTEEESVQLLPGCTPE